jgi:hypothetical protein
MPGTVPHGRPHLKPQISVVKNQQQSTTPVLYAIEKKIELSKPLPRVFAILSILPGTVPHGRPHLKHKISVVKNQQESTTPVLYAIEKKIELSKPLLRVLAVLSILPGTVPHGRISNLKYQWSKTNNRTQHLYCMR